MSSCAICGKTYSTGVSQRHRRGVAGKRWSKRAQETKRSFSPNIQSRTFTISGEKERLNVCTKCLKRIKKFGQVGKYSRISLSV